MIFDTDLLARMQAVFRDVLDDDGLVIRMDTSADDIEGWDSLAHVQIIVGLEKEFGIRFTARETLLWDNVGDMLSTVSSKVSQKADE